MEKYYCRQPNRAVQLDGWGFQSEAFSAGIASPISGLLVIWTTEDDVEEVDTLEEEQRTTLKASLGGQEFKYTDASQLDLKSQM